MTSRVLEIQKDYFAYIFYREDDKEFFKKMQVNVVPTVIIFDSGKEVKRYAGIVDKDDLVAGVKTKKQQWYPDWLRLW